MKKIEKLEQYVDGTNYTLWNAYRQSMRDNLETINFDDCIWDYDVPGIVKFCREFEVDYITITSNFSGMIKTLATFDDEGCKIDGFVNVKLGYSDNPQIAIKLKMN